MGSLMQMDIAPNVRELFAMLDVNGRGFIGAGVLLFLLVVLLVVLVIWLLVVLVVLVFIVVVVLYYVTVFCLSFC